MRLCSEKTLPALVTTFETMYEDSGDAEAYGLSKLLRTYKFVANLYSCVISFT